MRCINIILGLAAAVSAIDIRFWTNGGCGGSALICTNWNPNNCCGLPSGSRSSIGFYGIPLDWFLELRGHEGGNCGPLKTVDTIWQGNFKCLNNGPYTGAGYSFRSRRRGLAAREEACQAPDILQLEDGKKYSLVEMEPSLLDELIGIAGNVSTAADLPEIFQKFEVVE